MINKLKPLYKKNLETLARDYDKNVKAVITESKSLISEYSKKIEDIQDSIKDITDDEDLEPNKKYIEIEKQLVLLEDNSLKINKIYKIMKEKLDKFTSDKNIFVENCLQEHDNISEEDLQSAIKKIINI